MKWALIWLVLIEPTPTWFKFDTGGVFDSAEKCQKAGMLAMFTNSSAQKQTIEELRDYLDIETEVLEATDHNVQWECVPQINSSLILD